MIRVAELWSAEVAPKVRRWWMEHRTTLLPAAVALLSVCALLKIGEGFWRLVGAPSPPGAGDLGFRYTEVQQWFAGTAVYQNSRLAVYPPASYPMFWPLMGWMPYTPARWVWALTAALGLASLTWLLVKASGAQTRLQRALVVLLLLSMNATGLAVGNGQLILHLLPASLAGVLILRQGRGGLGEDLLVASLLLITMVKPTDAVPFFWLIVLFGDRLRPLVLVGIAYVALTLLGAWFQPVAFGPLVAQWLVNCATVSGRGCANLHTWLSALGLSRWYLPASFSVLLALGAWSYRYRTADPWILLGVTAAVTRVWTHHLAYDDVLMVVPMLALFRIVQRGPCADGADVLAALLLAPIVVVMLTPETVRHLRRPWPFLFSLEHIAVWIPMVIFLLHQARRDTAARATLSPHSREGSAAYSSQAVRSA